MPCVGMRREIGGLYLAAMGPETLPNSARSLMPTMAGVFPLFFFSSVCVCVGGLGPIVAILAAWPPETELLHCQRQDFQET